MLSPGERAIIKAEIERLQKAHKECRDDGIREKIDAWIVEQKQKLASGDYSPCPICGKPCPPEECVTVQGRSMHKKCYRASRISAPY
jgi:DNA repair exonuclease SbcCD ATPase subunit